MHVNPIGEQRSGVDRCGPGLIVDEQTGFKVTPGTRLETVTRLADAIEKLGNVRANWLDISNTCRKRTNQHLTKELDVSYMQAVRSLFK